MLTLACMEGYTYLFTQETRLQIEGGTIGLKVTQALARLYILWWDSQFLRLADEVGANIAMYKQYVDDTNIILEGLEPGRRWAKEHETSLF